MTENFELKTTTGDSLIRFYGRPTRNGAFRVLISCSSLRAESEVHDLEPATWSAYFYDLGKNWKGWKGRKEQESVEGQLKLSATHDSIGRVTMDILLAPDAAPSWTVTSSVTLDPSALEELAKKAQAFFI